MLVVRRILVVAVLFLFLILSILSHSACDKEHDEVAFTNPFDPDNPETHGDPYSLRVEARGNSVLIQWDEIPNISEVAVYRSTSPGNGFGKIGTSASGEYIDATAQSGITYYYQVRAYRGGIEAPPSRFTDRSRITMPLLGHPDTTGKDGATVDPTTLTYTIVDLGLLPGGTTSTAYAVNNSGQVVGYANVPGPNSPVSHAFLYKDGTLVDLGTLGGNTSAAYGINDSGQVVGSAETTDGNAHAFLYRNGKMTEIALNNAFGINNSGQVVGWSTTPSGHNHAVLWENGVVTDLGTFGGNSAANSINNLGQVCGSAKTASGDYHAFLWDNKMQDLGTLDGLESTAKGINDSGQVVGSAKAADGNEHAFLYSNGVMTDLGTLGTWGQNAYSAAYGINNSGLVVGSSTTPRGGSGHAFLYSSGAMIDLNDLLPAGSGWELIVAKDINDAGQIVGSGEIYAEWHAFLMTPTR